MGQGGRCGRTRIRQGTRTIVKKKGLLRPRGFPRGRRLRKPTGN